MKTFKDEAARRAELCEFSEKMGMSELLSDEEVLILIMHGFGVGRKEAKKLFKEMQLELDPVVTQ